MDFYGFYGFGTLLPPKPQKSLKIYGILEFQRLPAHAAHPGGVWECRVLGARGMWCGVCLCVRVLSNVCSKIAFLIASRRNYYYCYDGDDDDEDDDYDVDDDRSRGWKLLPSMLFSLLASSSSALWLLAGGRYDYDLMTTKVLGSVGRVGAI